jgi:hypothetical protein
MERQKRFFKLFWICIAAGLTQGTLTKAADITFEGLLTNFHNTRFVNAITFDNERSYIASTGGIMVFNNFSRQWELPMSEERGIENRNIKALLYHPDSGYLMALAQHELYIKRGYYMWYWDLIPVQFPVFRLGYLNNDLFAADGRHIYQMDTFSGFLQHESDLASGEIFWHDEMYRFPVEGAILPGNYMINTNNMLITPKLREYAVSFSAKDSQGNVWIGTKGWGLFRGDAATMMLDHQAYGLLTDNVRWISASGNKILMANDYDYLDENRLVGASVYNGSENHFQWLTEDDVHLFQGFAPERAILIGDSAIFITGSSIILYHLREKSWEYINPAETLTGEIYNVARQKNTLWLAAQYGLFALDLETIRLRPWAEAKTMGITLVKSVALADTLLYCGGSFGVIQAEISADGSLNLREHEELLQGDIIQIFSTEDIVILTDGSALYRARTSNFQTVLWSGLPWNRSDTEILSLAANAKYIWVGTNNGLWEYHQRMRQWRHIGELQGLPNSVVQALEIAADYLYIGTEGGMTRYAFE